MNKRLVLSIGLAAGLALLVLAALSGLKVQAAPEATCNRYVLYQDGNDAGNTCTDERSPCRTVQYALGQANNGERICVAFNTYWPPPSVYTGTIAITKSVTLDGAWWADFGLGYGWHFSTSGCHPERVILDAEGAGRVISITGAITPTITCFTITGGKADGAGGGIYSEGAAPVVANNVITGNRACDASCSGPYASGGGIFLSDAPATAVINGNVIAGNVANNSGWGQGGGIYLWNAQAQVLSNTIQGNRAGHWNSYGGGIAAMGGRLTIAGNNVLSNVGGLDGWGAGGGIYAWFPNLSSQALTIEHNLIQHNTALSSSVATGEVSRGGGLYYDAVTQDVPVVIRRNTIRENIAVVLAGPGQGGGMYLRHLGSQAIVTENTVTMNFASVSGDGSGGGVYLDECQATVADNAVFGNIGTPGGTVGYGGGMYVNGGTGLIRSNVITDNHALIGGSGFGGGVMISGSLALLQDNWIADNRGAWSGQGAGGGVFAVYGAPQFVRNQVLGNKAGGSSVITGSGGGFSLWATRPWLEGNTILDNVAAGGAQGRGGGVRLMLCPAFTLTNNIVARNGASALGSGVAILESTGWLIHNTVAENRAGDGVGVGIGPNSLVGLVNNIIVSQTVGITNTAPGGSTVAADHTLFEGNGMNYGAGVTSTNEVAGPAGLLANYHLSSGSNAIGNATPLAWLTTDIDGDPRPLGPAPDVGADEARFIYLPLVLRNY